MVAAISIASRQAGARCILSALQCSGGDGRALAQLTVDHTLQQAAVTCTRPAAQQRVRSHGDLCGVAVRGRTLPHAAFEHHMRANAHERVCEFGETNECVHMKATLCP